MSRKFRNAIPHFVKSFKPGKALVGRKPLQRLRAPELLEDRRMLALDTYVNDNWHLVEDVDDSMTVTIGDRLDSRNDAGTVVTAVYGEDGFGTVTTAEASEAVAPLPASVASANNINDAIAETDLGGSVHILEGVYTETVNINRR